MSWYRRDADYRYTIKCPQIDGMISGIDFYAGHCADGRQALVFDNGHAAFFDAEENFASDEKREPPRKMPYPSVRQQGETDIDFFRRFPAFIKSDEGTRWIEYQAHERARLYGTFFLPWLKELELRPGTVRVKRFGLPGTRIGITDLSDVDAEFLDDPNGSEPDETARQERLRAIQAWFDGGMFVLWHGRDLWLNREGDVEST